MSYYRYEGGGDTFEVVGVVPERGLLATIDMADGHRVKPAQRLTYDEWESIAAYLKFSVGLKRRALRAAMSARWGDSITFLEALYRLEDTR